MEFFLCYLGLSLIVAIYSSTRDLGFWLGLITAIGCTPLCGIVAALTTDSLIFPPFWIEFIVALFSGNLKKFLYNRKHYLDLSSLTSDFKDFLKETTL
jgi:hypothetical protein